MKVLRSSTTVSMCWYLPLDCIPILQLARNRTRARFRKGQSSDFGDHLQSLNHLLVLISPSNQLQRDRCVDISFRIICSRNGSSVMILASNKSSFPSLFVSREENTYKAHDCTYPAHSSAHTPYPPHPQAHTSVP